LVEALSDGHTCLAHPLVSNNYQLGFVTRSMGGVLKFGGNALFRSQVQVVDFLSIVSVDDAFSEGHLQFLNVSRGMLHLQPL
jgi:hypothetical protein